MLRKTGQSFFFFASARPWRRKANAQVVGARRCRGLDKGWRWPRSVEEREREEEDGDDLGIPTTLMPILDHANPSEQESVLGLAILVAVGWGVAGKPTTCFLPSALGGRDSTLSNVPLARPDQTKPNLARITRRGGGIIAGALILYWQHRIYLACLETCAVLYASGNGLGNGQMGTVERRRDTYVNRGKNDFIRPACDGNGPGGGLVAMLPPTRQLRYPIQRPAKQTWNCGWEASRATIDR
ncbi:hypothetical protein BP6252_12955 [Coleophoma cylindrospora]|uniref:Uncharacterized protein n=1 Tax=Coleophoma cylindrospora TaxID=1849047 RepID=A0A3D8QE15_9HELO|nr:hypothetical protein BP6252_12955 [Coleophoma cylindrospora]